MDATATPQTMTPIPTTQPQAAMSSRRAEKGLDPCDKYLAEQPGC